MSRWPEPSLRHVSRLTDEVGIVEHARASVPRRDLGYCTDDAGRALAVAATLSADPDAHRVATVALGFLEGAHIDGGRFELRLGPGGRWTDHLPSDDANGRALLGLGTAVARAPWPEVRAGALDLFDEAAGEFQSWHPRAVAYAVLGAVELLASLPRHPGATRLLDQGGDLLLRPGSDPAWPWPEARLTYANALLPEAALAVAVATGREDAARDALSLLAWLVREETLGDRFSFTPVDGRGPSDPKPAFDQQPIEAWAMVDACMRARSLTDGADWADAAERAARWFLGDNDVGVAMFDPITGGGFDGLEPGGVNQNQGAESTLAYVATMAQARVLHLGVQAARPSAASASRSSR